MLHVRLALPAQACGSTGDPKTGPSNAVGLKIGGTQLGKSIGEPKSKHIFKNPKSIGQLLWLCMYGIQEWNRNWHVVMANSLFDTKTYITQSSCFAGLLN